MGTYRSLLSPASGFILLLAVAGCGRPDPSTLMTEHLGFRVPEGFEVTLYADNSLAHDIYRLTVNSRGEVVVAGPNYVKILHDTDGDGRANRFTLFSDFPEEGARGMYFDGNDLIVSGDRGVWRLYDRDGDGVADGDRQLLFPHTGSGDHNANGIIRGPDGWYYWVVGDSAGINAEEHARAPGSPVKGEIINGAVVRLSPDGRTSDVYAHGFRNPYDLAFHAHGALLTYDADGERVQYLPWYYPTRVLDVAQGMTHGWMFAGNEYWNPPESHFDQAEWMLSVIRGSPTGVEVYRHSRFPERYRNGLFALCWSYGRIYFFPLERDGSTYRSEVEIFMESAGHRGFAAVGMEVGPEGDLFVATGGRGTEGNVYRIRYTGPLPREPEVGDPVRKVLRAAQPLSSWSRARWVPEAKRIGRRAFEGAAVNASWPVEERIRALEILVEVFGGVTAELARTIIARGEAELTARAIWAVSRSSAEPEGRKLMAEMTRREDPRILRAAWEALGALPAPLEEIVPAPDWRRGLEHEDRRVRAATYLAARGPARDSFTRTMSSLESLESPRQVIGFLYAHAPARGEAAFEPASFFGAAIRAFQQAVGAEVRLDALRIMQIGLGDIRVVPRQWGVHDGYVGAAAGRVAEAVRRRVLEELAPAFPTGHAELDRELARLLALLDVDASPLLPRITARWTAYSPVEDDIHYLLVAAHLPGERTGDFTEAAAGALARLHLKMEAGAKTPARWWPGRVAALFDLLAGRDPALAEALVKDPAFGLAGHTLFAEGLPEPHRIEAAGRLLAAAEERERAGREDWTPELIASIAILSEEEVLPVLREKWKKPALRDAIAPVLARHADPADRDRLVEALGSRQPPVVEAAAKALVGMEKASRPEEVRTVLGAVDYFLAGEEEPVLETLAALLAHWTGEEGNRDVEGRSAEERYAPWFSWFAETYPEHAAGLRSGADGEDKTLEKRLAGVAWEEGNPLRGDEIFSRRLCATCHVGPSRLGPDLGGVTARWSPEDLFRLINNPDRIRSSFYVPAEVVTVDGAVYTGQLVYDSPAVRLLQLADGRTIRLTGDEILEIREGTQSLMPRGLLRGLGNRELADLYAFLKTLEP